MDIRDQGVIVHTDYAGGTFRTSLGFGAVREPSTYAEITGSVAA